MTSTWSNAGYVNINDIIKVYLYYHFYNNRAISRALIGGQSCLIRVKNRPWKRYDGAHTIFSFLRALFSKKFQ